jgi:hypothetical protein
MTEELPPRRQTLQTIAWFWDLHNRKLLDLDPPYQRRSVWTQAFKDYFVDTLLLRYPSPALFLYAEMRPDGRATYHVVDGKQRLTTIFDFVASQFPVSEKAQLTALRGRFFLTLMMTRARPFGAISSPSNTSPRTMRASSTASSIDSTAIQPASPIRNCVTHASMAPSSRPATTSPLGWNRNYLLASRTSSVNLAAR